MERLASTDSLVVTQKKEMGEILTGFETRNRYTISDATGAGLYMAAEEGGSTIVRIFLKALRPFTMVVVDEATQVILRVQRPFRFFFYKAEVVDADGQSLGVIERRFSLMRRIYSVSDETGAEAFELFGPILHPWTFRIMENGAEVGKITKKWSGMLKETFTDADNFGVTFPADWDVRRKALFLGAVFLIDFAHFENKGK